MIVQILLCSGAMLFSIDVNTGFSKSLTRYGAGKKFCQSGDSSTLSACAAGNSCAFVKGPQMHVLLVGHRAFK
jgi:hypothetical protein